MPAPQPPAWLNAESQRIWAATVSQLGDAGAADRVNPDSLLAYVSAVATHQRATNLLGQTDILVQRDGKPAANPALDVQRQAATVIAQFERRYRLGRAAGGEHLAAVIPMQPQPGMQPRWCEQHKRSECTRPRSRGRGTCHGPAVLGLDRCRMHAGVDTAADPAHVLAVERRRNPLAGEPMDIGPAEALLWRVRVLSGEVSRLDEKIAALEEDALVFGVTEEKLTTGGADGPVSSTTRTARLSVWVVLREKREQTLHAACEAALRANIEERLVRLAEQQGAVIYRLLLTVLADFGVAEDDPRIPELLPMRLRELTA